MQLTALVERPDHVCCRYRIEAFRPFWERAGIELETRSVPRRWWNRIADWTRRSFDVAILQRRLLSPLELSILRRQTKSLIFDFDDAVWLRDSYSSSGQHSPRRLKRFAATIAVADSVIAGNEFLAEMAARFTSPGRVHVVPTCVDPNRYRVSAQREMPPQMVWVGSSSTLQGLERFAPVLSGIGRAVSGVRLKLICDRFLALPHLPIDPCPWSEATEVTEIAAAAIGISWLPDDDWSRGKCGLKVLQYMAAGLPVVANPVGVHQEMIRHGVNGFLVDSTADWIDAIRELASNPDLRRRMGQAGRERVERSYSIESGFEHWKNLFKTVQRCAA